MTTAISKRHSQIPVPQLKDFFNCLLCLSLNAACGDTQSKHEVP